MQSLTVQVQLAQWEHHQAPLSENLPWGRHCEDYISRYGFAPRFLRWWKWEPNRNDKKILVGVRKSFRRLCRVHPQPDQPPWPLPPYPLHPYLLTSPHLPVHCQRQPRERQLSLHLVKRGMVLYDMN